jgi:hypothetical protein
MTHSRRSLPARARRPRPRRGALGLLHPPLTFRRRVVTLCAVERLLNPRLTFGIVEVGVALSRGAPRRLWHGSEIFIPLANQPVPTLHHLCNFARQ